MSLINSIVSFVKSLVCLRYYDSIETLPIVHWFKINETRDVRILAKNDREFRLAIIALTIYLATVNIAIAALLILLVFIYSPIEVLVMNNIYKKINDQFLKKIGISGEYKEYLNNLLEYNNLACDYMLEPTPINKLTMNEKLAEIESYKQKQSEDIYKVIANISRMQGHPIDPKKVTVIEFYAIIDSLSNAK